MIIDDRIYISSMCPACGNYFYGSGVRSYNTFGATFFSDGYRRACYNPFWITQCPRCERYFAKEHLFKLPRELQVFPENPRYSFSTRKRLESSKLFGRSDRYFTEEETKMDFIEKAIEQGLYYPVLVSEDEKNQSKLNLLKDLWHEYNMHREARSDEAYEKLCRDIIEILESKTALTDEEKLTLAELYRNVGEFEICLIMLGGIVNNDKISIYTDAIRREAINKNPKTVAVIEGRW